MARRFCLVAASLLLFAGCGDDGPGNQNNNNDVCPEGHEVQGPACVPIFDDCSGPAEIPVLGGGCRSVGVTACADGFVSDGEGGCDPILPSEPCPAGTMEVIGETECRPVGVTACAQGFISDGEGGCDAVLPQDPCSLGTIEVLGHTECQPLGDCGTGTWGNVTTDATTVFVDQSADATGADGSDASPFTTIDEALAVAEPGGQIVVAAGDYVERLLINKRVQLVGRCPDLVTIRGKFYLGQHRPPVTVGSGGSGSSIRWLTLRGDAEGLLINGAQGVTVEEVQVVETGSFGIEMDNEAQATFRRVVVSRCTDVALYARGSALELRESVLKDTRPDAGGDDGTGVHAMCDGYGVCGGLTVARSLVLRNRDSGIATFGVDAVVTETVVQETMARQNDGWFGRGIGAQCHLGVGVCGSLSVTGSLVAGNREVGILADGVDVTVVSTVVRDTVPRQSDGWFGRGIHAQCRPEVDVCGDLSVTGSLVSGNAETGISSAGMDLAVNSTIVRDTLPNGENGGFGRGIDVGCTSEGVCAGLTVTGSLVAGNREAGIMVIGVDAEVTGTVVRDTIPNESDGWFGLGIGAQCDARAGACSSLSVTESLVVRNTEVGIMNSGGDVAVNSTVVRDTLTNETSEVSGWGINVLCEIDMSACGDLSVTGSVIDNNRYGGIVASGFDVTVTSTVVRDTLPNEIDGAVGVGVYLDCDVELGVCGSLSVSESLVAGNQDTGIAVFAVDATVVSTIVRDTLPAQDTGMFGRGINAQCDPDVGACGSLTVSESLVARNENVGIYTAGVPGTISGVAVIDTRQNQQGRWQDDFGLGILALCYPEPVWCGSLEVTSSVVHSSYSVGLAAIGVPGSVESSVIRSVSPRVVDDAYGYGIQLEGLENFQPLNFDVRSCVIRDASLAGILYFRARGTVGDTSISGGQYAVAANIGSAPEIADNNDLSGTLQDGLFWGNMEPAPAPGPAMPTDPGGR